MRTIRTDLTQEWLREGQVLGCVTTLKQALRGCKMVPLGAMDYVAAAAPAFAQARLAALQGSMRAGSVGAATPQLTAHNFSTLPFIAFNRKDDMQTEFVGKAFDLKRVTLNQLFVPLSEGQMCAVLAGWGVRVVPRLLTEGLMQQGALVNFAPRYSLPIQLYWHC